MDNSLYNKKITLRDAIKEAKGWYELNQFLGICSINPIKFKRSIDLKDDYFHIDKITIQKILVNIDKNANKQKVENKLYSLTDNNADLEISRGQIYWIDFGTNNIGSEQNSIRPALVIQNNIGNKYSPTIVVIAITTALKAKHMPTHVLMDEIKECGLQEESMVLTEVVRTIDKKRVVGYIGECPTYLMRKIEKALKIEFDLFNPIDVIEFVEQFANKFNLQNKFKLALVTEMKKYLETNNIDIKENIDNYVLNLKEDIISIKQRPQIQMLAHA